MPYKLVALRAVSDFDPSKPGTLPSRIKLLGWGTNATAKGPVILNANSERLFADFQKRMNWDRIAGDFEHNTVPDSPTYKGEPTKIASNNTVQLLTGDGLFADVVNWTPDGREFVGNGHYQDISAAVVLNEANEVIGLHSFAFCRKGATADESLTLFSSNFDPAAEMRKPVMERTNTGPQDACELMDALRTLTGSAADATPTQILRNLESQISTPKSKTKTTTTAMTDDEAKKLTTDLTALTAKVDSLTAAIDKLAGDKGTLATLSAEVTAMKTQNDATERESILLLAAREGKVVPVESAKTLTNVQLKTLVSELPVTVPLHQRTPGVLPLSARNPGDADGLTAADKEVMRHMGVSEDDFKKHGKAA